MLRRSQKGMLDAWLLIAFFIVLAGAGFVGYQMYNEDSKNDSSTRTDHAFSNLNPDDFSTEINNKYLSLPKGTKLVYEGQVEAGLERVEITISGDTKNIMGIDTLIYHDVVTIDGVLVEDTVDYLAQNKNGDVWYFGENVDNYENGKLVDHEGSWIAGEDGAEAGIWVKADPKVGETYKQEYYKGKAEDKVDVIAIDETIETQLGRFTNCLETYDYTPLDAKARENKFYCPEIKALALIQDLESGETMELISY